jgi:hypothetical protein
MNSIPFIIINYPALFSDNIPITGIIFNTKNRAYLIYLKFFGE